MVVYPVALCGHLAKQNPCIVGRVLFFVPNKSQKLLLRQLTSQPLIISSRRSRDTHTPETMNDDEGSARVAIGISFGNSYSSIARVDPVGRRRT